MISINAQTDIFTSVKNAKNCQCDRRSQWATSKTLGQDVSVWHCTSSFCTLKETLLTSSTKDILSLHQLLNLNCFKDASLINVSHWLYSVMHVWMYHLFPYWYTSNTCVLCVVVVNNAMHEAHCSMWIKTTHLLTCHQCSTPSAAFYPISTYMWIQLSKYINYKSLKQNISKVLTTWTIFDETISSMLSCHLQLSTSNY